MGYKRGLRTMQQTVCVNTPCDEIPANAKYVCHREFVDLAGIINYGKTLKYGAIDSQFITENQYLEVV